MVRFLVAISLLICFAVPCQARQISPVDGLEALRRTFAGISDFTAEITQEKRLSLMKRTMTMTGVIRFRKPDLFFMEISSPYSSRMVLRDNSLEQVMGAGGERNRLTLPPDNGLKSWFSKIAKPVSAVPDGMKVLADLTGSLYTVTITPQGKGQVRELAISFQEDGTVKRLMIAEQNGDRAVMNFRKVRRNTGLTEKDFKLE